MKGTFAPGHHANPGLYSPNKETEAQQVTEFCLEPCELCALVLYPGTDDGKLKEIDRLVYREAK